MNLALLIDPDDWNLRYNFACVLLIHLDEPDMSSVQSWKMKPPAII